MASVLDHRLWFYNLEDKGRIVSWSLYAIHYSRVLQSVTETTMALGQHHSPSSGWFA